MPRPNEKPNWSPSGNSVLAPSLAKRARGWLIEKPSHQIFNWFWKNVSEWIDFLSRGNRYTTIKEFILSSENGDTGVVKDDDTQQPYMVSRDIIDSGQSVNGHVTDIVCTGLAVVYAYTQDHPTTESSIRFETQHGSFEATPFSDNNILATDGRYLYCASLTNSPSKIEVFDLSSESPNTVVASWNATSFITAMACYNGYLYIAQSDYSSLGSVDAVANPHTSSPSTSWSYSNNLGNTAKNQCTGISARPSGIYISKYEGGDGDNFIKLKLSGTDVFRGQIGSSGTDAISVVSDDEFVWIGLYDSLYISDTSMSKPYPISADGVRSKIAVSSKFIAFCTLTSSSTNEIVLADKMSGARSYSVEKESDPTGISDSQANEPARCVCLDEQNIYAGFRRLLGVESAKEKTTLPSRNRLLTKVSNDNPVKAFSSKLYST